MKKDEILRGEKQFQRIIREGKTVRSGNILCHFRIQRIDESHPKVFVRAGFSVPRRGMNKAIDRNRVKRLMREAYRLNKEMLSETTHTNHGCLDLLFIYRGKMTIQPRYLKLEHVQNDMIRCLNQVSTRIAGSVNS